MRTHQKNKRKSLKRKKKKEKKKEVSKSTTLRVGKHQKRWIKMMI